MKRLSAQDSLLPQVNDPGKFEYDSSLLKGGKFEKWSGLLGAGLSGYAGLKNAADTRGMSDGELTTLAEVLKKYGITPINEIDPNDAERGNA